MDDNLEQLNRIDGLYDDDDDDDDIVVAASVLHLLAARKKKKRRSKWSRRRLDWDEHVGMTHNKRRDGFIVAATCQRLCSKSWQMFFVLVFQLMRNNHNAAPAGTCPSQLKLLLRVVSAVWVVSV